MNRPIAITGLALRLPQASSPSELADRLSGAFDAI